MSGSYNCLGCGTGEMEIFHHVAKAPVNSCILVSSRDEARDFPTGTVALGFCPACGFISNTAFDQRLAEYSDRYEETQGFSETFNAFHRDLVSRLIRRYDLHGKEIIEIGCGKGEFLILLCEHGENTGIGFDPSYIDGRHDVETTNRVHFIQDFYSEKYSNYQGDFLCCKMTLEHIHATHEFVRMTRRSIGRRHDTITFFMVPEVTRILRDCAFEDIYYEHCSYFSPGSLARLFRRSDFEILNLSTEYENQYLTIEAKPRTNTHPPQFREENDLSILKDYIEQFPRKYKEKQDAWDKRLYEFWENHHKVVLWGSGSKAVSFLTTTKMHHAIEYVVDINPFRQGYFMPGTGQQIVSPEFLSDYQPDVVIVMNRVYCKEVEDILKQMALQPWMFAL